MFTTSMRKPRKLGQLYIIIKSILLFLRNIFLRILKKYKQLKETKKKTKNDKILLPNDKEVIVSKQRKKKEYRLTKN